MSVLPPLCQSLGCNRNNIASIGLRFFTDDVGVGHIGKTSKKVTKVVRFDAPNVVRHGGVSKEYRGTESGEKKSGHESGEKKSGQRIRGEEAPGRYTRPLHPVVYLS